jgi:DNA-binding SARP family transcriptional activator
MLEESKKERFDIKMFGCFDIQYNSKSIFLETSSNVKSIEMLRFLLSQKDKIFTAEAIAENVWPDNEYLDEKKVIRTYIHRLRKILTTENYFKKNFTDSINIVNVKGGYKVDLADSVRLDIDLFDKLRNVILGAKDEETATEAFEQLYEVYGGEFLEECRYDHWAIMFRNYYLRTFSAVTCHVLSILQQNKNDIKMLDLCEKALKICELDENINIYFLQAMIESDQVANALQHYSFITSKMYTELSVLPSEKMRELYTKIKTYKSQEDAIGTLSMADTMDRRGLFNMVNEIVKVYLSTDKYKHSVAYIEVFKINEFGEITEDGSAEHRTAEEKTDIIASLKYALEYALRKNDMYTILDDDLIAIVMLYEAKVEYYDNIINRLTNAFYSRYAGYRYKIKIKISQVVTIR